MTAVVRCGTLIGLLVFSVACDAHRPTAPSSLLLPRSSTPPTAPTPTPPAPPTFSAPPLSGPSITYEFSAPLDYPVSGFTSVSKYVLYENGAFSLRYEGLPNPYPGSYRQEDGRLIFDFGADGRPSLDSQPEAIGTIDGDLLMVRYSLIMQHSDFENAVYRRTQ